MSLRLVCLGRLDRYVLGAFLSAYLICGFAFLLLFVVVDAFAHLDDFLEAGESVAAAIGEHYLVNLPLIFHRIAPALTLAGAMFALSRLRRNNELLPMLAAGIGLYRVLAPVFLAAAALSALMVLDQERLIPWVAERSRRALRYRTSDAVVPPVMVDRAGSVFWAARFRPASAEVESVEVTLAAPGGALTVVARRGAWDAATGRWLLYEGRAIERDGDGNPVVDEDGRARVRRFQGEEAYPLEVQVRPIDIEAQQAELYFLPFGQLVEQWRAQRLPRLRVQMHQRLAYPLSNLVLLLLGLPFVFGRAGGSAFIGLALAVAIGFAYFFMDFFCGSLGAAGLLAPVTAAWLPTAFFSSLGLAVFDGVRT
ncbi:MAG: LptF/LptG family permease [Planctomycetes bacterium]|nr:LptF/LptG family permease [Planctomycetota bacterium]